MIKDEEIEDYYSNYWDSGIQSDDLNSQYVFIAQAESRIEYLEKNIGSLEGLKILDFGAGHGVLIDIISKKNYKSVVYDAVELDKKVQKILKNKGTKNVYSKLEEINNRYDLIILSNVLEHFTSPKQLLSDIKKILEKDGVIFLEVPNEDYLHKEILEPHVVIYNKKSMNELLKKMNSDILNLTSIGRPLEDLITKKNFFVILNNKSKQFLPNIVLNISNYFAVTKFMENKTKKYVDVSKLDKKNSIKYYKDFYQLDSYGENRQWIRAIIKKPNK
jgi:2-polyprenyl-3-methyl-5-hydroxy-6-metoxy-1,4-benzoquinol methylase